MIALKEKLMDIRTPIYQKSITFTDYYFSGVVHDLTSNGGGPEFSGSLGDWLNKINNLGQRKWTDPETGTSYYINDQGRITGVYPITGMAPSPGKGSKFALQLSKQLANHGPKSVLKSYSSIQRRLIEHQAKLPGLQYKSSVEREIRAFKTQIEVLEEFMKNHGLIF